MSFCSVAAANVLARLPRLPRLDVEAIGKKTTSKCGLRARATQRWRGIRLEHLSKTLMKILIRSSMPVPKAHLVACPDLKNSLYEVPALSRRIQCLEHPRRYSWA